jgi:hypothetical protein
MQERFECDKSDKSFRAGQARLSRLHARVGRHFHRPEPPQRVRSYVQALLSGVDRKNGWQKGEREID